MSEEIQELGPDEQIDEQASESPAELFEEGEQEELMLILVGGEQFLVRVKEVGEILRPRELTPVPMAPDHLLGVANLHGQIVCVIEPGKVMHLAEPPQADTERTRYLVLRHPRMHVAIRIDEVKSLYRVRADLVPDPAGAEGFVRGELDIEEETYRLLHVAALFD